MKKTFNFINKKQIFALTCRSIFALSCLMANSAFGQFQTYSVSGTNHSRHLNSGNVVLGATNYSIAPADKLEVFGNIRATFSTTGTGGILFGGGLLHVNHPSNNLNIRLNSSDRFTILNSSGNVGIGTTSPGQRLEVNGNLLLKNSSGLKSIYTWDANDDNWRIGTNSITGFTKAVATTQTQFVTYGSSAGQGFAVGVNGALSSFEILGNNHQAFFRGKVGMGPTTPVAKLDISGLLTDGGIHVGMNDSWIAYYDGKNYFRGTTVFAETNASHKVGIGTASPDEKLTVKGKIHAEEVRVDLSVPGPDYVFEPEYNLMSLEKLELFLKSQKHLPEIPSAKEMEKNGINTGEMNMLLLKKIEELTLYIIKQEARIKSLESSIK
jgi:hypothetical protein